MSASQTVPNESLADQILIHGLEIAVQIGVPDEERAGWQTLRADLTLDLIGRVEEQGDDLSRTVDYQAVSIRLREIGAARPRRVIETLAGEIVESLLTEFPVKRVGVTLRKRVLPGVDYVAVRLERVRGE